jgi:hypothetical protein|tara:strand:+ start:1019 stop:1177 length:159 start_codon:yes stop_codon:yes gene_type:complete
MKLLMETMLATFKVIGKLFYLLLSAIRNFVFVYAEIINALIPKPVAKGKAHK